MEDLARFVAAVLTCRPGADFDAAMIAGEPQIATWRGPGEPPAAAEPAAAALMLARAAACADIDAAAELARLRWITGGAGQALVYQAKADEAARLAADAAPALAAYPLLAAEIGITVPATGAAAADLLAVAAVVLALRAEWLTAAAAIEAARLAAKRAVAAAPDATAIAAVLAGLNWPVPDLFRAGGGIGD